MFTEEPSLWLPLSDPCHLPPWRVKVTGEEGQERAWETCMLTV